ncbi:MAG TPA: bifunctional phosphopantothenoylcysteine decarboxylase/phosphopantothenate--cysteine ligase CoaBC [Thermoanaerobaculia bacterium]|nr:bifunctional phosphopantothenoylcysteine decarboxylase/phosphopantothenate--cysteine ligase CoaBC [Thermoanaerobaculia bacterium]
MNPPRVLLGVSGGIAAYKAVEVLRELSQRGADVRVAMTRGAREFVAPLTFATLSRHEVLTEVWGSGNAPAVEHVEIAASCDLLVVAPATAHTLAKLAHGFADDFLTTAFLAFRGPVLLAPAMESAMWEHPAVRANLDVLRARGAIVIGPESGPLASGREGVGRMSEPAAIAAEAWRLASRRSDLAGMRLLVTAGPTREPIDPIRFVSNRSSGRMGYALAEAARDRGAAVTLASGPTGRPRPQGVRVLEFETADDLHAILVREFPECDGLAMAAAVADFIPEASARRLHRSEGERAVRLAPGRDLLASLAPLRRGQTVAAFAAETEDLLERGRRKMEQKGADLVVVNDVGRAGIGFDAEDNEVWILRRDGTVDEVSRRGKREVADRIWDAWLVARASTGAPAASSPSTRRG